RLFEFAVVVAAGPPESIYRHTKLVTLKPKYIIENQTGLAMRVKQLGTRDPPVWSHGSRASGGFAHVLDPGQRSAVYWDDAEKPRELIVQPLAPGGGGEEWAWSGGFPIPETEWYFGLRIRHRRGGRRYLNIPANVTVGGSGCVQVTLKALGSVPPYRIENRCKDVDLVFIQLPLVFRPNSRHFMDRLSPGQVMAYAWDQPMLMNKLRVQARVVGRASESRTADYAPDQLGDAPVLMLPTHGGAAERASAEGRLSRTLSAEVPDVVKQKLVSLLAAEFSKKVYVSVYADGPTRVLRFSDEKNTSSLEQYHVILDLTARLKQVETQLREVSASFARLNGMAGAHALDLYGRTTADEGAAPARRTDLVRRASKRVPLSSALGPGPHPLLAHAAGRHVQAAGGHGGCGTGVEGAPSGVPETVLKGVVPLPPPHPDSSNPRVRRKEPEASGLLPWEKLLPSRPGPSRGSPETLNRRFRSSVTVWKEDALDQVEVHAAGDGDAEVQHGAQALAQRVDALQDDHAGGGDLHAPRSHAPALLEVVDGDLRCAAGTQLPSMTLLPSLYMSMLSTTLSGMKDWILAEKAVLPDPEGPARPTRMVSRFWEQSSWMARTTMKDPFSKLSRPSRGLMVYRERPSPDLYFTSSSWSFSKAWGIRGAGAAWDGALQGNAGWCGTGRHSAQQQLLCAAFLHIITFFSRDMGVRASPARDPFRTMSMAGSNSKYEIASEE
ncbi:hypothetical protein APUTEX25_004773, partial [Auxenochlorella protothecoides]